MLKNVKLYETELNEKVIETWYDLKYQFYYAGNSYYFSGVKLDDNNWGFVSVDKDDEILGMITFQVSPDTCAVRNFGMMSFTDRLNMEFVRDIITVVNDIFCKYHFNRMVWYCVDGNQAIKSYRRLCERHGGTVVAHEHECVRTLDGKLRDAYAFEILARNFIPIPIRERR